MGKKLDELVVPNHNDKWDKEDKRKLQGQLGVLHFPISDADMGYHMLDWWGITTTVLGVRHPACLVCLLSSWAWFL